MYKLSDLFPRSHFGSNAQTMFSVFLIICSPIFLDEKEVLASMPPKWVIALPQGGITTSQLNVLRQKYPGMTISFRPIRKGRINVEQGQDATWKELVIHGDPDFMRPILDECLGVI